MAFLGRLRELLARRRGTIIGAMDPASANDSVGLDVTTSRAITENGDLASWPVEEGAGVSDHMFRRPRQITLSGVVTDTPLEFLAGVHAARTIAAGAQTTLEVVNAIDAREQRGFAADAMRKLYEFYNREEPVYVACPKWTSMDMLITNIEQGEDVDSGDTFSVSITLGRIRIVKSALVPAEFDLDARKLGAGGTADLGTQSSIDPRDYTGPTVIR